MTNKRESNFELLRILSMLMIITHHLSLHTFYPSFTSNNPLNICFINGVLKVFGYTGNYLFMFISGYFLCKSEFSWLKLFKLWFQVFTTSVIIVLILFMLKIPVIRFGMNYFPYMDYDSVAQPCGIKDLIKSFMPTFFNNSWYPTTYLVFYCFVPYLQLHLSVLDEEKHKKLIFLMVFLGCIIRMIPYQQIVLVSNLYYFFLSFYVASYIRIYDLRILKDKKYVLLLGILCLFLLVFIRGGVYLISDKNQFINNHIDFFADYLNAGFYKLPIFLTALLIFYGVKNLSIGSISWINRISSTCFGVYLIHDNLLLNNLIWNKIFNFREVSDSKLILFVLFAVIIVFISCSILEMIRNCFFSHFVKLFRKRSV